MQYTSKPYVEVTKARIVPIVARWLGGSLQAEVFCGFVNEARSRLVIVRDHRAFLGPYYSTAPIIEGTQKGDLNFDNYP